MKVQVFKLDHLWCVACPHCGYMPLLIATHRAAMTAATWHAVREHSPSDDWAAVKRVGKA